METTTLEEYKFPEGISFYDFGGGHILVPKPDNGDKNFLHIAICAITDGKLTMPIEISSLNITGQERSSVVKVLKLELDKSVSEFVQQRETLNG